MRPVVGFRLTTRKIVCRECPQHTLTYPIAKIIPRAEANGKVCHLCERPLVGAA